MLSKILFCAAAVTVLVSCAEAPPSSASPTSEGDTRPAKEEAKEEAKDSLKASTKRVRPTGKRGKAFVEARAKARKSGGYTSWKRRLPFWPRKLLILVQLMAIIAVGVIIGQILEVAGIVRAISFIAWPIYRLGGLPRETASAFLIAFQSGAVANSILVSYRDNGELNNRQLYTSVLVVSCLSLFAHLPTFIVPVGMAFGWEATLALFGVRFVAIIVEIVVVLVVSSLIIRPWCNSRKSDPTQSDLKQKTDAEKRPEKKKVELPFWPKVWKRSRRTLVRLIIYVVPTFLLVATFEYGGMFGWLSKKLPGLFSLSFLPVEATAIIPAQAVSLYNGTIAAANFIDAGSITVRQAVLVILIGSVITAPIRTIKHALPTYVAVLGARTGLVMAVSAQVLRSIFVLASTGALVVIWQNG